MLVHPAFPAAVLFPPRVLSELQRAALVKAFSLNRDRVYAEDPASAWRFWLK